jgi:beta-galactosidase
MSFAAAIAWWGFAESDILHAQYIPPVNNRTDIVLNTNNWKFILSDVEAATNVVFDDSSWTPISIPHTWNNIDGQEYTTYYRGIGWYRVHCTPDPSYTNREIYLKFDGANIVADVYVNGSFVGEHQGGFSAFVYDVTPYINVGTDNVIAVKMNNAFNADIPPLNADFTFFGGIYRTVHLLALDKLHVTPLDYGSPGVFLMQTAVSSTSATLQVTAELDNDTGGSSNITLNAVIVDATNNIVATLTTNQTLAAGSTNVVIAQTTTLTNPHLWNGRSDPYMYQVYVQVSDGTVTNDLVQQPLGFRYFNVTMTNGFFLNGQSLDLHGVSFHQDRLNEGWAISESDMTQDISLVSQLGCTFVRLGHYQHPQTEYNLMDQDGIVVWSEVPMIDYITADAAFSNNVSQQLTEMIRQNYNHPAICFWGMYNEVLEQSGPDPRPLVQALNQLAHTQDPTRLTTAASCCADNYDPINFYTDVIGFNEYYGWYTDTYNDFGAAMDSKFTTVSKPMAISEYGAGGSIYQHMDNPPEPANPSTWGTPHYEEYENLLHESTWQQMQVRPYLWMTSVWNMFDFASAGRDEGDTPGRNDKGLVTYDRQTPKDAYYYYKANWTTNGFVYISSRRFTPRIATTGEVKIYSNCGSVQLLINGNVVGSLTSTNHIFEWDGQPVGLGTNTLVAIGTLGSETYTDTVNWVGEYAINCGGSAVGQFAGDSLFTGGTVSTSTTNYIDTSYVTNPAPQAVYQTSRYGIFSYVIPGLALSSNYLVRLHFAEYYWTAPGQRTFNVSINGTQVLSSFDILATAGAANRANIQQFYAVPDNSGQVTISFTTIINNSQINGIEIMPNGLVSNRPPIIALNTPVGGSATLNDTNSALVLNATVTDIGYPVAPPVTVAWTQIGGPPGVVFSSSNAPVTTASFPQSGAYLLQLTATAGQMQSAQNVNVTVNPTAVYSSGLIAYWKFDETSGTTAYDSSGNGLNATASSASLWNPNGYLNGCVNINGSSANNVNAGQPTQFYQLFSTGATVCAYINTSSLGGGSLGRIMDKSGTSWIFYNQNSFAGGQYQIQFEQTFTNNRTNKWQTAHVVTTNTWTHVAVSYSSSSQSNVPSIYVNGIAQAITDVSTGPGGLGETLLNDSAQNLYIGNRADAARPFGGRIDDVRIYGRAMSAAEVYGVATLPTATLAPEVNAGTNQSTIVGVPITLNGSASDNGTFTTTWSLISGPGNVTFGNSNTVNSTASFDTPGIYILQLAANNGQAETAGNVTVTVLGGFQGWQWLYFQCTGCLPAGATADPYGKGISNMNQFLLGLNPTNPASTFRIISISRAGGTNTVTWKTSGGDVNAASFEGPTVITNIVQGSVGATSGYSDNFTDISGPLIIVPAGDTVTNYPDASGTNRFYRIRLGP